MANTRCTPVGKGGTVVPPSDFQSVTTISPMNKDIQANSSRPCGRCACGRIRTHAPRLNVLIACEESQAECIAFRELGHNAYSCDIQPCRKRGLPQFHIQGDVTPYLAGQTHFCTMDGSAHWVHHWDLIIAHPPCTYLCKVGSPWLYYNPDAVIWRYGKFVRVNSERLECMYQAKEFFMKCLAAKADYVAVENPIPMSLANLPKPSFYACPSWFGVKYTKKTLYWVKNLPPLFAETIYPEPKCFVNSSRGKYRARTFRELAQAMAKQWSEFILNDKRQNRE